MSWSDVIAAVKRLELGCQLKGVQTEPPTEWTTFLIEPVPGSIESRCGPIPFREIEWLLVNPIHSKERGRLVTPTVEDRSEHLKMALRDAGMEFAEVAGGILIPGSPQVLTDALATTPSDWRASMSAIEPPEALEMIRSACANIEAHWQEHLEFWEGDDPGDFNVTSVFADYLVDMYAQRRTADFPAVFDVIERVIVEGTDQARSLAVVGVLESLRNLASHQDFGEEVFLAWMGPKSLQSWAEIAALWEGKSTLADVIRAQRCE